MDNEQNPPKTGRFARLVIWGAVIYFGPFVFLVVDQFIFHSRIFQMMPQRVIPVLGIVYSPVIKVIEIIWHP